MRCNVTHVVQALKKKQEQDDNYLFELQNLQLG